MFSHLLITLRETYRNKKNNYNNYTIIYLDVFK